MKTEPVQHLYNFLSISDSLSYPCSAIDYCSNCAPYFLMALISLCVDERLKGSKVSMSYFHIPTERLLELQETAKL